MEFKKTVLAVAITASSTFALMAPPTATKTYCLDMHEGKDGSVFASNCDQSANNKTLHLEILANRCANNQVALSARKYNTGKFDIEIRSCLPPNVVQL